MATTYLQPKLALRVGVTGHRDLTAEASADISKRVKKTLQMLKDALEALPTESRACYDAGPAMLRAISPLAEGADRIFAAEALGSGYELVCLLPFPREEYCKDFSGEASVKEFEDFLGHAKEIFELDGVRNAKPNAYESMGRLMLDHCDWLIAIYDDKHKRNEGGTAEIVDIARQRQMPIIWIHPDQIPDRIFNAGKNSEAQSLTPQLIAQVAHNLIQPTWLRGEDERGVARVRASPAFTGSYLASKMQGKSLLEFYWNAFMKVMTIGTPFPNPSENISFPEFADPCFKTHQDFINKSAERLAGLYRGAFLANYTLGVCAVFFALLSYAAPSHYKLWLIGELAIITIILLIITVLRRQRWHKRMVDCRYLAERFRIAGYLRPLGIVVPHPHLAAYHPHEDIKDSWMDWRLNAVLRETGMPKGRINSDYLSNCLRYIGSWLDGQISYHRRNSIKMHSTEKVLHCMGWIFIIVASLACVLHFFIHDARIIPWLTLCAAGFPAAAGACHAISNQGEFQKLSDRSNAMSSSLEALEHDLKLLELRGPLDRASLKQKAIDVAEVMLEEVTDWQVLYRKPPILPT